MTYSEEQLKTEEWVYTHLDCKPSSAITLSGRQIITMLIDYANQFKPDLPEIKQSPLEGWKEKLETVSCDYLEDKNLYPRMAEVAITAYCNGAEFGKQWAIENIITPLQQAPKDIKFYVSNTSSNSVFARIIDESCEYKIEVFDTVTCLHVYKNNNKELSTFVEIGFKELQQAPLPVEFTMQNFEKGLMLAGLVKPANEQEQKEFDAVNNHGPLFIDTFRANLERFTGGKISIGKLVEGLNIDAKKWALRQSLAPLPVRECYVACDKKEATNYLDNEGDLIPVKKVTLPATEDWEGLKEKFFKDNFEGFSLDVKTMHEVFNWLKNERV